MSDAILVLNAGSSSLKFEVFLDDGDLRSLVQGQIEGLFTRPRFTAQDAGGTALVETSWEDGTRLGHNGALDVLMDWARAGVLRDHRLLAAGHRVVHGGVTYREPVRISREILERLTEFVPLAPLHQPHNLAVIREIMHRHPELPQVGCFDTAFHRTQPDLAQMFALPREFFDKGVLRYGFHGLSYEYIASVLSRYDSAAAKGKTVVAHLGNGSSLCALDNCRSIATSMGFTALDGVPMGTRCGAIDPGVLLYCMDHLSMDYNSLETLLYQRSGLLGVSGVSSDMRALLASDDPRAAEAIALYVYRIAREIGALVACLGGLDALVFTAGIGENAARIRAEVVQACSWLGFELDNENNQVGGPRITRPDSRASAWVIPTDEELMIARHTRRVLNEDSA
jgi:acetate kinase